MFIPSVTDAPASTASPTVSSATTTQTEAPPPPAGPYQEPIRHMLFGTLSAVQATIRLLHAKTYAEPNDWSQPIPTGRPGEVMAILTKRIKLER
ncbi:MAG: hypothetical protein AAFQ95_22550 [Cyanobacteria bacterium J06621_3]